MSICACGHVQRMHASGCTGCGCLAFTLADDPAAATDAARARQVDHQHLVTTARRALARGEYDQLLGAALALLDHGRRP